MAHLKWSIIEVNVETKSLAHALIIAVAKITNDPNYNAYRHGWKIRPVVHMLLEKTGIEMEECGAGIHELSTFKEKF